LIKVHFIRVAQRIACLLIEKKTLCPGCVTHGIPQASAIDEFYTNEDVQVIGLHTVFEHHKVMNIEALKAFVHEYRIRFPIAVDSPSTSSPIPLTMGRYQMKGTPTLIVLDKQGRIRLNHFGRLSDMQVGSIIGGLLAEESDLSISGENIDSLGDSDDVKCDANGCLIRTV
jgi:peroxiredoxin